MRLFLPMASPRQSQFVMMTKGAGYKRVVKCVHNFKLRDCFTFGCKDRFFLLGVESLGLRVERQWLVES